MVQWINRQSSFEIRFTLHGCRKRYVRKGASLVKEAVLADSVRAGEKSTFLTILCPIPLVAQDVPAIEFAAEK